MSTAQQTITVPRNTMGRLPVVAITPAQQRMFDETRAAFVWNCPAFTHILYTMLNKKRKNEFATFTNFDHSFFNNAVFITEDVAKQTGIWCAATDGTNLLINPTKFFEYNLSERIFIVAHEVLHCVFDHCGIGYTMKMRGVINYPDGTALPYEDNTMNRAMDFVINDILVQSQIGAMPKEGCHDPSIITEKMSAVDAYRVLYEDQQKNPKGGKGSKGKQFDGHMKPGTVDKQDAGAAVQQRNEVQWKTEVAAAAASAKAQGKLPAGLERLLTDLLEPQVDWADKIRSLFSRRVGRDAYDWRRLDRRLIVRGIGAPGKSGFGCGTVVVGIDTSGSIDDKTVNMFLAEVSGILEEVRPRKLHIVWCDAQVQRVDELDEASDLNVVRHKGAPGGGGTAFEPVFDWIYEENIEPDALVYLTDGMGSFPSSAPTYPVIWGNITPQYKYPWGDVVDVPKQK